jgi:hypothetical protein
MATDPARAHEDWPETIAFYRRVLNVLAQAGVPVLVGGGYEVYSHTGIARMTKDLDLFLLREDVSRAMQALAETGFETELTYSHWLAKARLGDEFVDLIFNSGNGRCPVDQKWFEYAREGTLGGQTVLLCPPEESIWQKAFIMERERFDGADVAHLIRVRARTIDWDRLIERFGSDWRVLFSHLILFGFIYPGEQTLIPVGVMNELTDRLRKELEQAPPPDHVCAGTLLSRQQYLVDVEQWKYSDVRLVPGGTMTQEQITNWTPEQPVPVL